MEVFEGTVRLADDTVGLRAVLLVADNRLKISAREHQIGDWDLRDVAARVLEDGCHVSVEGEDLIVSVPQPLQFAEAIGPRVTNPGDGSLRGLSRRRGAGGPGRGLREGVIVLAGRVPKAGWLLAACVIPGIVVAAWAPVILVGVALLGGVAGLLLGGFALLDPFVAVRLPDRITPGLLIRVGIVALGVGIGLAIVI